MYKLFQDKVPFVLSNEKRFKDKELRRLDRLIKKQIKEKFASELNLYIVDSASCSACELELQTLFNPLYNISKSGVKVVYEIEKADILIITGLISENMYKELLELYQHLKTPKRVIFLGDCPLFKAPFQDTFALRRPLEFHFSSAYTISGCPPEPKKILNELLHYLKEYI